MDEKSITRFWSKVDKRGAEECWEWQACRTSGAGKLPYGLVVFGGRGQVAHRVSWQIVFGAIPHGQVVRHKCDNPPCVNPNHLELGSPLDNARDALDRNRYARGTAQGLAKLTEEQVLAIRRLTLPINKAAVGRQYGVSRRVIYDLLLRNTWTHI